MKKAIIYTRVSSQNDRQNNDRQINDLSKYADANNLEIVGIFNEQISGATKNADREVLNNAFELAKKEGVEVVLFSELSRLGRSALEVLSSVKYLADNNINGYFQKENFSILNADRKVSPITMIYISCLSMCAEFERENIKFRLNSGRELAKQRGVKMGRHEGSKENLIIKENKYPITLKYIRKGYKPNEILRLANGGGEKVSIATIHRLKNEMKKESV